MRVLCLSADMELASLRRAVLATRGIDVDVARSKKEAEQLLQENTYRAVLICHSISEKTARQLAALFRERNSNACLIFVSHSPWQQSPVEVDASVCAIDGPENLVETVLSCDPTSSPDAI